MESRKIKDCPASLRELCSQDPGFTTPGLRESSLQCWLLAHSFLDAFVGLGLPRRRVLETQNLIVKSVNGVPQLQATENFHTNFNLMCVQLPASRTEVSSLGPW